MNITDNAKYATPVLKKNQPDDKSNTQPLPRHTGSYPYHLNAQQVIPDLNSKALTFHMIGDTGSVRYPDFQHCVVNAMARQYQADDAAEQPRFLYHLGDIVYHFGEAEYYPQQFFKPYGLYPAPVFAIAGNHDTDVNATNPVPYQSLDAFMTVFCGGKANKAEFSSYTKHFHKAQPHVYWTLQTPLANIIGLHSNVPKYGYIDDEQRSWFINELKAANQDRPGKALIVCVHHAPYSADINHSSSLYMIDFLEQAFEETGVKPNAVFSGHVHNYQRFSKQYGDGTIVPFIVCGSGGFDELHSVATVNNDGYTNHHPMLSNVSLEKFVEQQHGFMKISITKNAARLTLTGEYYTLPRNYSSNPELCAATLADRFEIFIL